MGFEEESERKYDCIGDMNFRLNILMPSLKPRILNIQYIADF
jgi:hypothetical protein